MISVPASNGILTRIYAIGLLIIVLIFLVCFSGYAFAFGNMSYWGIQVIFGFLNPIEGAKSLILGDFEVGGMALAKLLLIHFLMPFVVVILVMLHLFALHSEGSSAASVTNINASMSVASFMPYLLVKDSIAFLAILIFMVILECQFSFVSHPDNKYEADAMVTPDHILPEWYFLPLYSVLKIINQKECGFIFFGVIFMTMIVSIASGNMVIRSTSILIFLGCVGAILPTLFSSSLGLLAFLA